VEKTDIYKAAFYGMVGAYAFISGFQELLMHWLLNSVGHEKAVLFFDNLLKQTADSTMLLPLSFVGVGLYLMISPFLNARKGKSQ